MTRRAISLDGPLFEPEPEPKRPRAPRQERRRADPGRNTCDVCGTTIPATFFDGRVHHRCALCASASDWARCRACDSLTTKDGAARRKGLCWTCHVAEFR